MTGTQEGGAAHEGQPKTVFIACAALGREVKQIIKKHGWHAEFQAIDARLHLRPAEIGPAVRERLEQTAGRYERRVVVYGHSGAMDLDDILAEHDAVRPLGPHCYEMYGGEAFAQELKREPGTFILTDYLIHAWEMFVVRGLKLDQHPQLKPLLFRHYRRVIYFSQEKSDALVTRAQEICDWLQLPLEVRHVGYGDLERRLEAIMTDQPQPTSAMTHDGYSAAAYPTAADGKAGD